MHGVDPHHGAAVTVEAATPEHLRLLLDDVPGFEIAHDLRVAPGYLEFDGALAHSLAAIENGVPARWWTAGPRLHPQRRDRQRGRPDLAIGAPAARRGCATHRLTRPQSLRNSIPSPNALGPATRVADHQQPISPMIAKNIQECSDYRPATSPQRMPV